MSARRFKVGIVGLQPGRSWAARAHIPALRRSPTPSRSPESPTPARPARSGRRRDRPAARLCKPRRVACGPGGRHRHHHGEGAAASGDRQDGDRRGASMSIANGRSATASRKPRRWRAWSRRKACWAWSDPGAGGAGDRISEATDRRRLRRRGAVDHPGRARPRLGRYARQPEDRRLSAGPPQRCHHAHDPPGPYVGGTPRRTRRGGRGLRGAGDPPPDGARGRYRRDASGHRPGPSAGERRPRRRRAVSIHYRGGQPRDSGRPALGDQRHRGRYPPHRSFRPHADGADLAEGCPRRGEGVPSAGGPGLIPHRLAE